MTTSQKRKTILLGQLGSYGDCLYATTVARQIKNDYPDCHLTWAIGSRYSSILNGNPHVDEIWEIPITHRLELLDKWEQFEMEAQARKKRGDFDEVFLTQVFPNNLKNYDGTLRASIFRGYPRPIIVPIAPVLQLLPNEVEHVHSFADKHQLSDRNSVILFECLPESGQSFVTPEFALAVARELAGKFPNICIILSSHTPILSGDARIIDGSVLSFRENAELTKYCSLIIGCSSGISWLCTTDWAKPLPMIQLLKMGTSVYASFVHDFKYQRMSIDTIIEMTDCTVDRVTNCVIVVLAEGFKSARHIFHERIPLRFNSYYNTIFTFLIKKGKYKEAALSLMHTTGRYGLHPWLVLGGISNTIRYLMKIIRFSLLRR